MGGKLGAKQQGIIQDVIGGAVRSQQLHGKSRDIGGLIIQRPARRSGFGGPETDPGFGTRG